MNVTSETRHEGGRDIIIWTMEARFPITEEDAVKAQEAFGYNPEEYRFYGFRCKDEASIGAYEATWKSSRTCD